MNNPLRPVGAARGCMGTEPSTGAWDPIGVDESPSRRVPTARDASVTGVQSSAQRLVGLGSWSCVGAHSCSEFRSEMSSHVQRTASTAFLPILPSSLFSVVPEPWNADPPFSSEHQSLPLFILTSLCLCFPLHKEASLTKAKGSVGHK